MKHGEEYFTNGDQPYEEDIPLVRSILMTIDFSMAKDSDHRFKTTTGQIVYFFGAVYLNIIILNLVIALVGNVYNEVMDVRKETELKLKATMLKELYDFKSCFRCIFKETKELGNLFVLRLAD